MKNIPLAERIRPETLDDVVGQSHIIGKNAPLTKLLDSGRLVNMIFYGPSGTGKTTVANIIAKQAGVTFYKLNATSAGSGDIRDVLHETETLFGTGGILLYLDEIQYLNKKQQQTLLEYIEDGRVTLIASTTENPYFAVYKAILSRCTVFEFKQVPPSETKKALLRGFEKLCREFDQSDKNEKDKIIDPSALDYIVSASGGDIRSALNALELSFYASGDVITEETARSLTNKAYSSYDPTGDDKYELVSALQKSIRGSDENAAVFYLARLLQSGDLLSPCRRLLAIASEDIGLAFPMAAAITKACVDSALYLGLPEASLPLSEAAVMLATAPKSNSAYMAYAAASKDIAEGRGKDMPAYLKNNHMFGESEFKGEYKYPHDYKDRYVEQQYLPNDLKDRIYYEFASNKTEQAAKEYWDRIKGKK
ncbi:putative AAA domain-containing protein [bioreactor metagenome]|uniref:Putative AAA domain-containing protein n=1 Tax=bioreactor metagenome TaxID=1076179 RepID=A0A644YDA8_9ZZZZ|nr:replication-associated recombination protein A [Oscillospiraceae bacterium]